VVLRALLDVNVLIALLDSNHLHYNIAQQWVVSHRSGFASCPLTQNGALRIMANPSYASGARNQAYDYPNLFKLLKESLEEIDHVFLPDDVSLLDEHRFKHNDIHSHKQLTDIYLLALAVKHDCTLVTFDNHIPPTTVVGATQKHLTVLR
jgi:toxin-antitoxin system PIN domain toxin